MTPAYFTLDLGLRHKFQIGSVPVSLRMMMSNIFDKKRWDVVAANTIQVENRRRMTLSLTADF